MRREKKSRKRVTINDYTQTQSHYLLSYFKMLLELLPPASAVEVIKTEPSVGVCVCVSVLALSQLNRLTYGPKI